MEFSPETIFISYSRSDGRAFAEAFERRLEAETEIRSWRDLKSVEGGEDIRPQVLRAIEKVKHLVLILSRRALESDWVKGEWTHARMVGRKVSPVLADPAIKRSDLPNWIRRADVYDIAEPERWRMLVRVLGGAGETRRVPYMSGDLPDDFVLRPEEYGRLKEAVLSAGSNATVGITTALQGAGGYGKTTLANALCRDPDVRFEFTDGILRVEIGKERNDVTGLIVDLIEKLDPNARRPGFQDIQTAAEHLGELIGEARLLLVIDDVWREAQLRPFLRGGPNCVRLVTTRLPHVLPKTHSAIDIDEMRAQEALSLISANLPAAGSLAARGRLAVLAKRLGYWAQMLSIANGWIRDRVAAGEPFSDALDRFEQRLKKRGLTAFDPKDEAQRNRAIHACVEASLEDLDSKELARLSELAIFPEDEIVPLGVVEALWAEAGGVDEDDADQLIERFGKLSQLQGLDRRARTVWLHDNMIWYLRDRIGADGFRAAHAAMVRALRTRCDGNWAKLPPKDAYGWRFLIRHLRVAGQDAEADGLLVDYAWIKAKLEATGPPELFASYLPESQDDGARLVGRAIALSLPALAANPRELPRQLFGRLGSVRLVKVATIAEAARRDMAFPRPRWPGLTPPGAEQLCLVGHEDRVTSAAFSPDGARILTASDDGTARVWDAATGQEVISLRGHEGWGTRAAFSPDGCRIVTGGPWRWVGSPDMRLWDAATGQMIAPLPGQVVAFSPDGTHIVTLSYDGMPPRLCETVTGQEIISLRHHSAPFQATLCAAFSPDGTLILTADSDGRVRLCETVTGQEIISLRHPIVRRPPGSATSGHLTASFSPEGARIITASDDGTVRVWDAATGREIISLRHPTTSAQMEAGIVTVISLRGPITSAPMRAGRVTAVFSPDGAHIFTASDDGTVRVWDAATGQEITCCGYEGSMMRDSFSPDGACFVTASEDGTARLWEAMTGQEIISLRGHERGVTSAAFSHDGARIVTASEDRTARVWDATREQQIVSPRGHEVGVTTVAFSPDGTCIVTASDDSTARVWDAAAGQETASLDGHEGRVMCAAFSPDGARILTASEDATARLWETVSGQEIISLRGHGGWVTSAAFSPDGARIVTASIIDRTARLWDAAQGHEITSPFSHDYGVTSSAFSPDGARVITTSFDRTARLWAVATGQEIAVLRGHQGGVTSAVFSPNGARIITASDDRTARAWDAVMGKEIASIALDAAVTALAVKNGDIALGDALGRIHVFEAQEFLS